jgi:hypothetical protein
VLGVDATNEGRIRVDFTVLQEPDLGRVQNLREVSCSTFPLYDCSLLTVLEKKTDFFNKNLKTIKQIKNHDIYSDLNEYFYNLI